MDQMLKRFLFTGCSVIIAALLLANCSRESGKKVVIKGSTTVLPITQKTTEEFRKVNKVSITIEGSAG